MLFPSYKNITKTIFGIHKENRSKINKVYVIGNDITQTFYGLSKHKKGKILTRGSYHKPFYRGIRIDDSKKFEYIFIHNAAKSQKIHGGILVNNKKYYDSYFYNYKNLKKKNSEIILCKNNKKLILIKW